MCQIPRRGRGGEIDDDATAMRYSGCCWWFVPFSSLFFSSFLFFEVNKVEGCYFRAKAATTSSSTTIRGG
jgi:hypothetical protein